jgi:hypothetical protein
MKLRNYFRHCGEGWTVDCDEGWTKGQCPYCGDVIMPYEGREVIDGPKVIEICALIRTLKVKGSSGEVVSKQDYCPN